MRWIDADAFRVRMYHEAFNVDSTDQRWDSGCWIRYRLFERVLDAIPAADVAPVRHGMWREITEGDCSGYDPVLAGYDDPVVGLVCSCCGDGYEKDVMGDVLWNYCPNCGAKMDGGWDGA